MENKLYHVSLNELTEIKDGLKKDSQLFIAEIDGTTIQNEGEFLSKMNEVFKFPRPITQNGAYFDVFNDWMTDLDWLNKDGYALIINNYSQFLTKNEELKTKINYLFEEHILPFWQDEVIEVVGDGVAKPFNVYLVN